MINKLFSNVDVLKAGLDASWLKNQVIANNIANVDTPNFKSSSVSFEAAFKRALQGDDFTAKKTREKHIDFEGTDMRPTVTTDYSTTYRMDGNNVNIDAESAKLAKNQIFYNTLAQQISSELRKLNMAINGGK
ncbi:MAG: flagellar basal body rod protein FlgB [Christensenellales bacterium]